MKTKNKTKNNLVKSCAEDLNRHVSKDVQKEHKEMNRWMTIENN